MKIAIIVSTPMTIRVFLKDQILHLSQEYDVTVVANLPSPTDLLLSESNITLFI